MVQHPICHPDYVNIVAVCKDTDICRGEGTFERAVDISGEVCSEDFVDCGCL